MYITVRYGECKCAIFNPNCRVVSLLQEIKSKCDCDLDSEVDLSDESGNLKHLRHLGETHFANELLGERETFVLIRVDRDNGDIQYTPLLRDEAKITEAFLARLASRSDDHRPNGRRGRSASRDIRRGSKDYAKLKQLADDKGRRSSKSGASTPTRSRSRQGSLKALNN